MLQKYVRRFLVLLHRKKDPFIACFYILRDSIHIEIKVYLVQVRKRIKKTKTKLEKKNRKAEMKVVDRQVEEDVGAWAEDAEGCAHLVSEGDGHEDWVGAAPQGDSRDSQGREEQVSEEKWWSNF